MADLKVFVSHSFDEADADLVNKILEVMQRRKFHLEIKTARNRESRPFPDKIMDLVAWADVTFGIYTKKFVDSTGRWFPPNYVVSECSYAVGIVEDPIRHESLALNVAKGEEFPSFHRKNILDGQVADLEQYLHDLTQRHGAQSAKIPGYSYKQKHLRKTVEVYRNGLGVFKNKNEFFIRNAQDFVNEGNQFVHHIWLPNKTTILPDFEEMLKAPVKDRYKKPFFVAMFFGARNGDRIEQSMKVTVLQQDPHDIKLAFQFPFSVKDSDILEYQYVWGLPKAFYPYEEEQLRDGVDFQEVPLVCRHGQIDTAELRVKFERETVYGRNPHIFSKQPFVVFSRSSESEWLSSKVSNVQKITKDSVFETYEHITTKLGRGLAIRWRPGNKSYIEGQLRGTPSEPFKPSSEKTFEITKGKRGLE
jgi:hypothetical protein